jgi:predicted RNA-binding Zn-ribbon protein involved in translation (DUF1610 family)
MTRKSHISCIGCEKSFTRQTRYVGNYCPSCRIVSADLETESDTKTDTQTDTDE